MSQTIFVLEDDADISRLVQYHLEAAGFTVQPYFTQASILADAERQPPALFLLDIMVPGGDGLDLCRRLRQNPDLSASSPSSSSPRAPPRTIASTASSWVPTTTSPSPSPPASSSPASRPCCAASSGPAPPPLIRFEHIEIDASAMQLRVDGELVTTTATEFRLLDYLARHPGRVFSRDHLLDAVWGDARFVTPRSVDVYVRRIREKIEADAETPRYLKTMRGAGYRFEIPKAALSLAGSD